MGWISGINPAFIPESNNAGIVSDACMFCLALALIIRAILVFAAIVRIAYVFDFGIVNVHLFTAELTDILVAGAEDIVG